MNYNYMGQRCDVEEFSDWLAQQLRERGWSRSEAARRGGVSASMYDKVLNGYNSPGLDFYKGVARAFGLSLEEVLRIGKVLPTLSPRDRTTSDIIELIAEQRAEVRDAILRLVVAVLEFSGVAEHQQSEEERQFLRELHSLSPEKQAYWRDLVRADLSALDQEASDEESNGDVFVTGA